MKEKATHQDDTDFEGPVDRGNPHAKRPADKIGVGDMKADTSVSKKDPAVMWSGKVSEEIARLFDGVEGLSEGFTTKAAIIVEGLISERVEQIKEELAEEMDKAIAEQMESLVLEYEEKLDGYVSYVAEEFVRENQLAIDRGIRNEIAEQVLEAVGTIIESHGLTLPEEKVDVAESLTADLNRLEADFNRVLEENIALKKEVERAVIREAFNTISEGLTDAGKDKLRRLSENISYRSVEDYKRKVSDLKESLLGVASPVSTTGEELNEAFTGDAKDTRIPNHEMSDIVRTLREMGEWDR